MTTSTRLTNNSDFIPASAPAATVTVVELPGKVEPEGLRILERPLPSLSAGQAVVAVEAAGVSFAEQQMRRGKYYDQPPFPFVPGYDCVGVVTAVDENVDSGLIGRRVAVLTKIGSWATAVVADAADLVPVPPGVDPAEAETLVVNGITAWQMLHRAARISPQGVRPGTTVVVHGANGGVGSTLVQLARHAGVRVIGTCLPRNADAVRALGAEPVDYAPDGLHERIRALAPEGVDAVFDHIGGPGIVGSWRLLRRGGTLVAYGSASTKNDDGNSKLPILALFGRLTLWRLLPNGRRAVFYNIWSGRKNVTAFRARLRADLGAVFNLLAEGELTAQVAARVPLEQAAYAMRLAESKTVVGKLILTADPAR